MHRRYAFALLPLLLLACGAGPTLETRTFQLRHLDAESAAEIVRPYVFGDRPNAPGTISARQQTLTVRDTRDNIERVARVLAEHDRPAPNIRLVFTIIRADGPGPLDSAIAPIEAQLRRLFRFRGYQLVAQSGIIATSGSPIRLRMNSSQGMFDLNGGLETLSATGDSAAVRLNIDFSGQRVGTILTTRLGLRLGHTAVLGGQPIGDAEALILAVRAELAEP